ncbi:UDP-3-O-acyl-N-acetylglucosamine deacetylase, partial [Acinetobacter baumannii]
MGRTLDFPTINVRLNRHKPCLNGIYGVEVICETTSLTQKVMINFIPHTVDGGIVFRRIDLDPPVDIPANALLIQEAFMCSNLVTGDIKVGTIEHVMSAIAGLGIDNLIVEVSASEVPIMDGSAGPFIYLLMQGGLREQDAPKKFIKILKPVEA